MYEKRVPAELTDVSVYKDENGIFLSITYKNAEFDGERRDVYIPKVRLPIPVNCLPTINFEESGRVVDRCFLELFGPDGTFHLEAEPTDFHLRTALGVEVEAKNKRYAEVRREKVLTEEEAMKALKEHFGCPVKIERTKKKCLNCQHRTRSIGEKPCKDCYEHSEWEEYDGTD